MKNNPFWDIIPILGDPSGRPATTNYKKKLLTYKKNATF